MGRSASTGGGGKVSNVIDRPPPQPCPVKTCKDASLQERMGMDLQEIRAYKLGKRRWSYNQVELVVCDELDKKQLTVTQTFFSGTVPGDFEESALAYNIHLSNGQRLLFELYLVYDSPHNSSTVDRESVEWYVSDVLLLNYFFSRSNTVGQILSRKFPMYIIFFAGRW